ncbi:universal stress protein [Bradyrhizobium sp. LM2.3]
MSLNSSGNIDGIGRIVSRLLACGAVHWNSRSVAECSVGLRFAGAVRPTSERACSHSLATCGRLAAKKSTRTGHTFPLSKSDASIPWCQRAGQVVSGKAQTVGGPNEECVAYVPAIRFLSRAAKSALELLLTLRRVPIDRSIGLALLTNNRSGECEYSLAVAAGDSEEDSHCFGGFRRCSAAFGNAKHAAVSQRPRPAAQRPEKGDIGCIRIFSWLSTVRREALAQAEKLASVCGATVHLLAIIDLSESMIIVEGMSFVPDNQRFVLQTVLDEGVKQLGDAGCSAAGELKYGKPTEQIILSAREINADLIIIGHRDQGTLARWLSGSVGESILHRPPCSMLVAVRSAHRGSSIAPIPQLKVRGKR